uniref:Cytoplasmic tRNA 2-thiolation protein 2 n=1 Tax=Haemonchus contortus TaxID=6289 RepID=A0A7I4YZ62_HAECO
KKMMNKQYHSEGSYCNGGTSNDVKCVKCHGEAAFESNNTSYCEKCFLAMVKGKFRSSLSKRRIFRDKDSRKALVVLDGSRESAFLFRQIEDSVKQTNFKRLMIEPSFLLLLSSLDISEIRTIIKKLSVLQQALPCTYFVVHLAAIFGSLHISDNIGCIGIQHVSRLDTFLRSFRSTYLREEMIRLLNQRLIREFSKCVGISKVMVPSSGDDLARLAVSQLCLGRGGAVSDMTDVVENISQGITLIRPLRSVSSKEIATALQLENVEHYVLLPLVPNATNTYYAYEARSKGSIQQSTSRFLNSLQEDGFKGTVPNILGAISKIHIRNSGRFCSLCECYFCEEGALCYTCSNIMNELPFSIVDVFPLRLHFMPCD